MLTVGAADNVVRLLPPLIIDETHLDEAVEKIGRACVVLETKLAAKGAA
jgi:acetylornithine/N-succinyldiaminopimelate aminotransferase